MAVLVYAFPDNSAVKCVTFNDFNFGLCCLKFTFGNKNCIVFA